MSLWSTLFGSRPVHFDDDMQVVERHPRFNSSTKYIQLQADEIEALPIVEVDSETLYGLQGSYSFTPVYNYPSGVSFKPSEYGYDAVAGARYVEQAS